MAANTAGIDLEDRWRSILSVHARTTCEIDRALHPHGLGASDFEVLDILAAETPGRVTSAGCRTSPAASTSARAPSPASSALLEKDGLVERSVCMEDRRGVWVALTPKGRDLHDEVLPLQREVLSRMLTDATR